MISRYHFDSAWLGGDNLEPDVVVAVEDDSIVSVGLRQSGGDAKRIKGVAIPGLISAHSHAFHRALRGRTHSSGGDFWAWRQPMYEIAASLTPETYETLAESVFREMLASGITTVGEFHYVHHRPDGSPYDDPNAMGKALVNAAVSAGIRLTLLDALYLTADVSGSPLEPHQARFSDGTFHAWRERIGSLPTSPMAKVGVAAHSVRAVPVDMLASVAEASTELSAPLHIHVSEQPTENQACLDVHGVTPISLLDASGFLGPATTLVHATHTTDDDRALIARSGAGVCFCPTTEADLGDGVGPAAEYAEAGVPISLGSDSNAIIDPFEEMRRVEHHDRLRLGTRGVHSPAALMKMGTAHGARSLGWHSGAIAEGRLADLVVVDPRHLDFASFHPEHGLGLLTMAGTRSAVTRVMVGGRWVVEQ